MKSGTFHRFFLFSLLISLFTHAAGSVTPVYAAGEPTVLSIVRASANPTSASSVDFTVTFSEDVVDVDGGDFLPTAIGVTGAFVSGVSGSGSVYTVTVDTGTGSGSLRLDVPDTASITDTELNALLDLPFTSGDIYDVDKSTPSVTQVFSDAADGSFNQGDSISVKIQFSEVVNVTGGTPSLCFETGATDRCVDYASGSGTDTLVFNDYVVQAGDNSSDLEVVDTSALSLNGASLQDAAGNNANLTLPTLGGVGSFSYNNNFIVDTTAPTVSDVSSNTSNGVFNQGDSISVKIQFSEVVHVTGGTPSLCLETGATDRCVNYASGSGSDTLVFDNYIVQAGDTSSDLEYVDTSALQLNSAAIRDTATNDASLTLPVPGASGSFSYNNNFVVDTTAPTVTSVISNTSDGIFRQGDHISVQVQFSEVVNVNTSGGTPSLCFETGATDRCVNYASGSGSNTIVFEDYIVQAGDTSSDLEYVNTSALALNAGTIKDAATNDASLTLPVPGASGSFSYNNNFVVDTTAPTVTSVISNTSDGIFRQGDHISVQVQFSEVVNVNTSGGTPSLCFETGATDRCVNYASGSGSDTLVFEDYIVQAGDISSDLEYVNTSALALNAGTIKDAATNNASLTLKSPGTPGSFSYNNNFVVDTTSPVVTYVISSTPDNYYNQGDSISVKVQFSDVVNVNTSGGTPSLCLETGATDRCVNYASGSGSDTLVFDNYIVQAGDNSPDLEYVNVSSLSLNGGTIKSQAGNDAILTLPTPGGPGSFSYNNTFVIDTIPPTVNSIILSNGSPTTAASVEFFLTFSEYVNGVSSADFSLTVSGLSGASVSVVGGDYAWYDITASTGTGNGSLRLDIPNTATITDFAGNPISGLPFTSGQTYSVVREQTFQDVPSDHWAWELIERLYIAGITGGCSTSPLSFCPDNSVTRAQMAIFLLKSIHGSSYAPPAVGASTGFGDVATDYWAAAWIKQLAAESITGGCGNANYCPDNTVTRAQMAVFLLKATHGTSYVPPAVGSGTGFTDVPSDYWAAAWIKQLAAEGITGGCGTGIYCPDSSVTRAQMAIFLVKAFSLP